MSLLKFPSSANLAQHFAANRGSQSAREAELCHICQGDPQRAFSEILQSCDQGKLLQKEGNKKHLGANAIMSYLAYPRSANRAQHLLQTAAPKMPVKMSNLPRRSSAGVSWNSAKLRPVETPAKRRPQKTPWRERHHVFIKISLKCNLAQHFAANRGSQSAREAELCQIFQGDPQSAFSEILQSCDQG